MPGRTSSLGYVLSAAASDKDGGIDLARMLLPHLQDLDINSDHELDGEIIAPLGFALAAAIDCREGGMRLAQLLVDHPDTSVNTMVLINGQFERPLQYLLRVAHDDTAPEKMREARDLVHMLLAREDIDLTRALLGPLYGTLYPVDWWAHGILRSTRHPKAVEFVKLLLQREDLEVNMRLPIEGVWAPLIFAVIWMIRGFPKEEYGLEAVNDLWQLLRREDLDVNAAADFKLFDGRAPENMRLNVLSSVLVSSAKGCGRTTAALLSLLLGREDLDINCTIPYPTGGADAVRVPSLVMALEALALRDVPMGNWVRRWLRRTDADVNAGLAIDGIRGSPIGRAIALISDGIEGGPEILRLLVEREDIDLCTPTTLGPDCPLGPPLLLVAQEAQMWQQKAEAGTDKNPFVEFLPLMMARGAPPLDDVALQAFVALQPFVQSSAAAAEGRGDSTTA